VATLANGRHAASGAHTSPWHLERVSGMVLQVLPAALHVARIGVQHNEKCT